MSDKEKPFSISLQDLDSKLVFTRFGELAKRRDSLYADYIEIDEPDEIGNAWVEFSGKVVNDLLEVVNLTKSLFERLIDELRRSQNEPGKEELNRIRSLTDFWLDLSIMSYLYATIEKRGVLDQKGTSKYSLGYIDTKKSLDELTLLAFQAGQEFFSIDSRIVLGEALSLNMEKKRLDFLEGLDDVEEMRNQILGNYDRNQAQFLMTRVFERLISSAESWWFLDPIGLHSASEHAMSHIESMKEYWTKCTSDFVEKALRFFDENEPTVQISSKVSLAQHYLRLAMAALETRSNNVASQYFGMAAELINELGLENLGKSDQLGIWNPSVTEQYLIFTHMEHLASISSNYQSIIRYLQEGKTGETEIIAQESLDKIQNMLSEGDLAYVSSVAVAYETAFVYIKEEIAQKRDPKEIIAFVENRVKTVGERLRNASHQIVTNWLKVIQNNPGNVALLNSVVANIDYPLMAIFVLPPDSELVNEAANELLTLKSVTEALNISAEAEKEFGKNPVKEMLMRAKTFELTHLAMQFISKVSDEETAKSIKEILNPVARNAFLRGLIAEIQLRTAVLQYRYINRIAPLIENSALSSSDVPDKTSIDDEELSSFMTSLEELNTASREVNTYQAPISIGGAPLNWAYISKIQYYTEGLVEIVKSVKFAINAATTDKKQREDAVTYWDEAKTLAFTAADIIAKAQSQDSEGLAQQVYALAQVYFGFENKMRDRKDPGRFPVEGIVELISSLLMGL